MLNVSIRRVISRIGEKVKIERSIHLTLFLYILLTVLVTDNASAEAWPAATVFAQCNGPRPHKIPVPVPSFSCKDGVLVPKKVKNGKCKRPEALYNRCIYQSRLGRLAKDNPEGVDIIFSCRKDRKSLHKGDTGDKFFDIAVIQHDRKTGNTCFYQYLSDKDDAGPNIPAPGTPEGNRFWTVSADFCTECHTNGPFVRSPHYWEFDVSGKVLPTGKKGKRVLPNEGKIDDTKYRVLHEHFKVANVSKSGNDCNMCHNIGAYNKKKDAKIDDTGWEIGHMNELAAGEKDCLRPGCPGPSPTKSGFHDFMANRGGIGGRSNAKAALQELVNCLTTPRPAGCTVTPVPDPMVAAQSIQGALIYIKNDTGPSSNSVFAHTGSFAPICGTGANPRLPGLDLVRKFTGRESCPSTTNSNRFNSQPNFVFLIDDTSPLSSYLTNYFQSQNLLQDMDGRKVIAPGIRVFHLRGLSIKMLFVGEMAYRKGGSNATNWFNTLNATPDTPFVVAGP